MVLNSARLLLLKKTQIILKTRQLTSIQYANHFYFHKTLFLYEKEKPGLLHRQNGLCGRRINYLKSNSFHSNKFSSVNNSNFAGQKVNISSDVKHTTKNEGKEDIANKDINIQTGSTQNEDAKSLTLVGKFKKMAKEYWYVLIPVHAVTSVGWIGGFYYASLNGVDIVGILENLHISETIISKLRDSSLGHWAIAYLLYKIASPVRYTVTIGGTTYAINILSSRGIIKPMPTKEELVQMYKDKKDDIQQKIEDNMQDIQQKIVETKLKVEETKEKVVDKKDELYQKIENKKQGLQQKVADKKQELKEKIKG